MTEEDVLMGEIRDGAVTHRMLLDERTLPLLQKEVELREREMTLREQEFAQITTHNEAGRAKWNEHAGRIEAIAVENQAVLAEIRDLLRTIADKP